VTEPNTPIAVVAGALDPALQKLVAKAQAAAASKLGTAGGQIVAAALPVLWKMGVTELSALVTQLENQNAAGALQALQDAMTLQELADQKKTLVTLTAAMAQAQHDNATALGTLALNALTLALSALVAL
jgi:hypothetical protein